MAHQHRSKNEILGKALHVGNKKQAHHILLSEKHILDPYIFVFVVFKIIIIIIIIIIINNNNNYYYYYYWERRGF